MMGIPEDIFGSTMEITLKLLHKRGTFKNMFSSGSIVKRGR